ncbi:MAG: STAS domain-containing protein [Planctomycetota bacterium]|jgi:anti-sigma B factor antagonist
MAEIQLSESTVAGCPVVALAGELNITTASQLRDVLMPYVKTKEPCLVVDLSGLKFMDTSGLATLIEAHLKTEQAGGGMALCGLREPVAEIFDITKVTRLFSICETEQEAVDLLRRPPEE